MTLYWPFALVQDKISKKVSLWQTSLSETHLNNAIEAIAFLKENYKEWNILSAWVNTYDENNKKCTVFHECYVDVLGYIVDG